MSVTVGIVTWNSASVIEACLAAVRAQTYRPVTLRVLDNASSDGTRAVVASQTASAERLESNSNLGFSAAHNRLIAGAETEFYLCLNPDVELAPDFLERMVAAMRRDPQAGAATGKLLRRRAGDSVEAAGAGAESRGGGASAAGANRDGGDVVDSTGIIMLPSQRHLDRGADTIDAGQYAREQYVFGASGAAACYRTAMLQDVSVPVPMPSAVVAGVPASFMPSGSASADSGTRPRIEYFDEDFFAYREDADLAWRAQLLGWSCLYVPHAVARHGRRVTPERRGALPAAINAWSVRNRFLLRIKNQTVGHALRFLLPTIARDLQVIGYVLLKERTSLGGLADVLRLLPRMIAKRQAIMARRRRSTREMIAWFTHEAQPRH